MIKKLVLVLVAATVAAPAWTADRSTNKEENVGVGGGAAIGAVAGGPVGLIVGAALGAWVGDRFHQERAQRREAEEQVARASMAAESSAAESRRNERELASLRAVLENEQRSFAAAIEEALEVQIYFRTAESALEAPIEERLAEVAGLIKDLDGFSIVVEGHADARGAAEYNEQLSAERAAAVRDVLLRAGIGAERITTYAVGESESKAQENDLDALALERRVNLTIVRPTSQKVAGR